MFKVITVTALAFACTAFAKPARANDCGWSDLSQAEQNTLATGNSVMRTSTASDGTKSHIDQWAFGSNPSLTESVANFSDQSTYKSAGGVADIALAFGQKVSDNPVEYDVTPRTDNPFKTLYVPFRYALSVKVDGDGYNVQINYLSSPGLIQHVLNDVCMTKLNKKVLIRFLSTITDSTNPMLARDGQVFGWDVRKMLWKQIFSQDVARASEPGSALKVENLKSALLGNFGN